MNKERRNEISKIMSELEELKSRIDDVLNEEQEAFDNMPESLQSSDRGQVAEEAISYLESAQGAMDEAFENLESASA